MILIRTKASGFTLIELLVVVAIVGIVASIGFTNIPHGRIQVREAAKVMSADLNRARSEAIRLNTNVAFRVEGSAYSLFIDTERDGTGDTTGIEVATQPEIFRRTIAGDFPRVSLNASGLEANTIWFDARGLPRTKGGEFGSGTFKLNASDYSLEVRLESQGRVQVVSQ